MVNYFNPLQVTVPSVTEDPYYGGIPGVNLSTIPDDTASDVILVPKSDNYFSSTGEAPYYGGVPNVNMSVTDENVPYSPTAPDWKLRGESVSLEGMEPPETQVQPVVQAQPVVQEEPSQADTGFNWRGVLDRVLSSMNDPENDEKVRRYASNVNQWVQDFGTSPFLALADPENAVHRLRQQANVNAELAAKRRGTTTPSADVQFLEYLQGKKYSLKDALDLLGENKRRGATQVNVGGEEKATDKYLQESNIKYLEGIDSAVSSDDLYNAKLQRAYTMLARDRSLTGGGNVGKIVANLKTNIGLTPGDEVAFQGLLSDIFGGMETRIIQAQRGGSISDSERSSFAERLPGLQNHPNKNLILLRMELLKNELAQDTKDYKDSLIAQGMPIYEVANKVKQYTKERSKETEKRIDDIVNNISRPIGTRRNLMSKDTNEVIGTEVWAGDRWERI